MYIACICISTQAIAFARQEDKPRLVIGIVVDQMRYDYLLRYWDKFGENGFKKLINEGFLCSNTHYNYVPTYTGPGHASIFTGTSPAVNGIISNNIFDRATGRTFYCVHDESAQPVGTKDTLSRVSPRNMYSSTIGDQLHLAENFASKVIGIALKDRAAILPAGHSANAAYWFDGSTGKWVSSSYYMDELPKWARNFNDKKRPDALLAQQWNTLLPIGKYTESSADDNAWETPFAGEGKPVFPHDLPALKSGYNDYNLIKSTPFGNTLTREFAEAAIKNEQLGKDGITDMLTLSFSATDYVGHSFGPHAVETEDTYLRLDRDIAYFIEFLNRQVGNGNYLLFLTADHGISETPGFLQAHKMPGGYFNTSQMLSQLKAMLAENFGSDAVLQGYNDMQFYLNREILLKMGISENDVIRKIRQFVIKLKGVSSVVSVQELACAREGDAFYPLLRNGIHPTRSGDVIMLLQPGWISWYGSTGTTHGSPYPYDTHVPLIWFGDGIPHGRSSDAISITDIAPTVSHLLGISAPNGNTGRVIPFLIK